MTQKENLPSKYNPYKAAYSTHVLRDPKLEAQKEAFWGE